MEYVELLSIIQQLLVAGIETTAHTLTAGLYYLLKHPEQMEALRADPSLVDNFVEETLRYLSPHLAFGAGIHTCIGAQLARKELQTAFPILLKRLKNVKISETQETLAFLPSVLLRGVVELNIEYEKV